MVNYYGVIVSFKELFSKNFISTLNSSIARQIQKLNDEYVAEIAASVSLVSALNKEMGEQADLSKLERDLMPEFVVEMMKYLNVNSTIQVYRIPQRLFDELNLNKTNVEYFAIGFEYDEPSKSKRSIQKQYDFLEVYIEPDRDITLEQAIDSFNEYVEKYPLAFDPETLKSAKKHKLDIFGECY